MEEHFFAISLYDQQAEGGGGRVSFDAHLFCEQKYLSILTQSGHGFKSLHSQSFFRELSRCQLLPG